MVEVHIDGKLEKLHLHVLSIQPGGEVSHNTHVEVIGPQDSELAANRFKGFWLEWWWHV